MTPVRQASLPQQPRRVADPVERIAKPSLAIADLICHDKAMIEPPHQGNLKKPGTAMGFITNIFGSLREAYS